MSVFCACAADSVNGNTGLSNAALSFGRLDCLYLVPTKADDGTKNTILASDFVNGVLPASYINEKLNHINPSKRWYPVKDLRSVTNERATPETQTFDGGQNSVITAKGLRTFVGFIPNVGAKYLKNLERIACQFGLSVFEIDECGALAGQVSPTESTVLTPKPIASRTFNADLKKAQATDSGGIDIQYEYKSSMKDSNECIVPAGALGLDLCDQEGLLNLLATISNESTTGFTAALRLEYGGFPTGFPQTGLLPADFTIFNETTQLAVVILTAPEVPAGSGSYDFTFAGQTAADVLTLKQAFTSDKYDKEGFELVEPSITIP